MKNKKFRTRWQERESGNGTARVDYNNRVVKTFSKSFDAGVSIFLELRTKTDVQEYEVPQQQSANFSEYEVVGNKANGDALGHSYSKNVYATGQGDNYYVEPFEESNTPQKACCDECATSGIKIHKEKVPEASPDPLMISQAPQQSPGNYGTEKMLNAISDMASSKSNDDMDDNFLEDMKTILQDPKSYRKEKQMEAARQVPDPSPTKEDDIFEKIARNMQYANQYDFGTLELEKRFDEFDRSMAEVVKPVYTPAMSQYLDPQPVVRPNPNTVTISTSEFLKDLDLITEESKLESASKAASESIQQDTIPLDPGIGGRSIMQSVLQPGDLIISTTSDSHISKAIRAATGSQISHASVFVGNGKVIHSTDLGVSEWTVDELLDNSSLCVAYHHSDMNSSKGTAVVQFLKNALASNKGFDSWALLYAAPSQLMATYCDSMQGVMREACLRGARSIKPGTDDKDRFYCSELVFAAYKDAGLSISTVDPSFSSPQDVVRLFHDGTLQYVGHLKV